MSLLRKYKRDQCQKFLWMLAKVISPQIRDERIKGDKMYRIVIDGATLANLFRLARKQWE